MPRIGAILRVLKIIFLCWIVLIGSWIFLPSPAVPRASRQNLIQKTISSSRTLHVINEWDRSFAEPRPNGDVSGPPDDCSSLLIDWRLVSDVKHDSVELQIGSLKVNLTDAVLKAKDAVMSGDRVFPYLSEPLNTAVGAGSNDHVINMPWFFQPDAALFHHHMHGFTYDIKLRVLVTVSGQVEVWKSPTGQWGAPATPRLQDPYRENDLLAAFEGVPTLRKARSNIMGIKVLELKGQLPSQTYKTRLNILTLIEPSLIIALVVLQVAVIPAVTFLLPFAAVYIAVVFVWWLCAGLPRSTQWWATFWLTRCFFRDRHRQQKKKATIWGATGPLLEKGKTHWADASSSSDEEYMSHSRRRSGTSWPFEFRYGTAKRYDSEV